MELEAYGIVSYVLWAMPGINFLLLDFRDLILTYESKVQYSQHSFLSYVYQLPYNTI